MNKQDLGHRKSYFGVNIQKPLDLKGVWEIFIEYGRRDILLNAILFFVFLRMILLAFEQGTRIPYMNYLLTLLSATLIIFYKALVKYTYSKSLVDQQILIQSKTKSLQKTLSVIRDGKSVLIDSSDLLVGDILIINVGDIILCDGILTR